MTLSGLWGRVAQTLRDPTSNLTATAFLLAAVVVLLLIVIMLILVWISAPLPGGSEPTPPSVRGRSGPRRTPRTRRGGLRDIPGMFVAAALVVAALTAAGLSASYAGNSSTCIECHAETSGMTVGWSEDVHAAVDCLECHSEPGLLGRTTGLSQYLRWVSGDDPDSPKQRAFVPDTACLDCHATITEDTTQDANLQVRHEDFVSAYDCIECHPDVGHGEFAEPAVGTMSRCVLCHDNMQAPAACETCHLEDVSRAGGTPPDRFPKVDMGGPENCEGCHSLESCDACHGLRMPHTADFVGWEHGREAAWGNTEKCEKCHSYEVFCGRCHDFPGHAPNWRTAHGPIAKASRGGCLACHAKGDHDFCAICHGD